MKGLQLLLVKEQAEKNLITLSDILYLFSTFFPLFFLGEGSKKRSQLTLHVLNVRVYAALQQVDRHLHMPVHGSAVQSRVAKLVLAGNAGGVLLTDLGDEEKGRKCEVSKQANWCFTPSQPVRLYISGRQEMCPQTGHDKHADVFGWGKRIKEQEMCTQTGRDKHANVFGSGEWTKEQEMCTQIGRDKHTNMFGWGKWTNVHKDRSWQTC